MHFANCVTWVRRVVGKKRIYLLFPYMLVETSTVLDLDPKLFHNLDFVLWNYSIRL